MSAAADDLDARIAADLARSGITTFHVQDEAVLSLVAGLLAEDGDPDG